MWAYAIVLCVILFNGILYNQYCVKNKIIKHNVIFDLGTICSIIVLILIAGFRSDRVGVDLWNYENSFTWRRDLTYFEVIKSINGDHLYYIFERFFSGYLKDFNKYLFVVSLISIAPTAYVLTKISEKKWLSLWLYVTMGYYVFTFSALRQSIAISFSVLCFYCVTQKKFLRGFLCFIFACMFHNTAVVILPIFFINKVKIEQKKICFLIISAVAVFIFRKQLFLLGRILFDRTNYEIIETGGKIWWIAFILMFGVGVSYRNSFLKKTINSDLFLLISIALIIMPICFFNPALFRMCNYYSIYLCSYLPNWIKSLKTLREQVIVTLILMCITIVYFFGNVILAYKVMDYQFFWNYISG